MVLDTPYLTLSDIRYVLRVKWDNPGKGVAPSPNLGEVAIEKGALDYGRKHNFYLDQRKTKQQLKSKEHLCQVLQDGWNNKLMDYINKLQISITKRINAVLPSKGGHL